MGQRDRCLLPAKVVQRDALTTPRVALSKSLIQHPLPQCGGLVFFHLPKTGGFSLECFLGAQPQHGCCYRSNCGFCRSWRGDPKSGGAAECQHRGLLPTGLQKSSWKPKPRGGVDTAMSLNSSGYFVLPNDLMALDPSKQLTHDFLGKLRFVTTQHMGP